jgi:VWFA-related protein
MDENSYTFSLLNAANVAVYPLDARHGANTTFAVFDASRSDAPVGQGAFAGQKGRVQNQDQEIIAMFQQIAANTGGKSCFNRTDLANCLKEFATDSRDYYMVGFYVDKKMKPGWHVLNVKLDRKADLRHRRVFAFTGSGVGLLGRLAICSSRFRRPFPTQKCKSTAGSLGWMVLRESSSSILN